LGAFSARRSKQHSHVGCRFGLTVPSVAFWPAAIAIDLAPPGTSGERKRICSEEEVSEAQKTILRCEELASQKWLPPSGRFCGTCSTTFFGNILGIWISLSSLTP
jgi:hypothetical protein